MRTLPITESPSTVAWLESTPRDGQEPIRAELTQLPFTIGRNESCDLTIESARISREHLRIEQGPSGYRVRDLGSTNGTYVNGVKITESPLADGDLLAVANFGLSFHLPRGSSTSLVTQRFTENSSEYRVEPATPTSGQEIVEAIRRLQELGLNRALRHRVQAIVDVQTSEASGYEVRPTLSPTGPGLNFDSPLPDDLECHAVRRMLEMYRRTAVEQAWACLGDVPVFLSARASEIRTGELLDALDRLRQRPGGEAKLVLQVPDQALTDHDAFRECHEQLKEIGVLVAIDQFAGSASQLAAYQDCPPDYLRLAAAVVQGLSRSPDQRRRTHEVIQAAGALGTRVIACGVTNEEEWHACKSIGVTLAQGDYAAASLPLDGYATLAAGHR